MRIPVLDEKQTEKDTVLEATKFMVLAAWTAPKTAGIDDVSLMIF